MALLALLDWVPPLPIPFVVRFLPGAIAKADLNTYDRATSATRLQSCFHRRWRDVTSRRHICTHLYTLQPKKIPNCNRVRTENVMVPKRTIWFQNVRFGSKTDVFGSQNSSREDTPEHASAAWDHWTGRDCAAGRPSRSLCLDLTSGPPLDAPASHSHPTPPSMDTDSCTAPCLNARGVWILTRQGTGSRGTTAPAAPRRWVHRSRRGPPSKTGAPAARVLCAPAWPPSCRCESRIPPQQPYSQVADCQLSRPHHPSRRWRRRAR